jgi:hypothetical protein
MKKILIAALFGLLLPLSIEAQNNAQKGVFDNAGRQIGYVISDTMVERATILTASLINSSNATYTTICSFTATAGKKYKINVIGAYQTAATTTGLRLKLNGTALGSIVGVLEGSISNLSTNTELSATVSNLTSVDQLITTGVATINTPTDFGGNITLRCTTSGTVNLQFASEINASACTVNAGSGMYYTEF